MASILVVEDNFELAGCIVDLLTKTHQVTHVPTVAEAKTSLIQNSYHLVLLDVELPDGSGFNLYEWIATEVRQKPPVIFLTGEVDLNNRLKGLELGAKDYILKPFYSKELVLRIEMQLKQSAPPPTVFIFGDLKIERNQLRVFLVQSESEVPLNLTPNEFKILSLLIDKSEQNVSRDEIINNVWGQGFNLSAKAVNTHISNLRKKMQNTKCKIISSEGKGYCLHAN
jgi:DNA-binding response OmpR family regulator